VWDLGQAGQQFPYEAFIPHDRDGIFEHDIEQY
jgi:hypothetical protein